MRPFPQLTLEFRTAWFTYKISVRLSFPHRLQTVMFCLSHIVFGLDIIAIRGVPSSSSQRSYVIFMVL